MRTFSATDYAIAYAAKDGTLRLEWFDSRFGEPCFVIADDFGTIEVHLSRKEAEDRLRAVVGDESATFEFKESRLNGRFKLP